MLVSKRPKPSATSALRSPATGNPASPAAARNASQIGRSTRDGFTVIGRCPHAIHWRLVYWSRLLEVGQHLIEGPPMAPKLRPLVVFERVATQIKHAVNTS